MDSFSTYTAELGEYAGKVLFSPGGSYKKQDIQKSLFNTKQVERHLRSLIPIEELRDAGSFFTGDDMAEDVVGIFEKGISRKSIIIDPACGAGNLLIACSKKLPIVKSSLRRTLETWGSCLIGFDLFPGFVEATKLRLVLEAVSRGAEPDGITLEEAKDLLGNILESDAFDNAGVIARASHIIINPPFYRMAAGDSCHWAAGKINAAAKFMEFVAENAKRKAVVSAILPDVLRSGSRYEKWRKLMASKMACTVFSSGRFDSRTDVDVFMLSGQVSGGTDVDWLGVNSSSKSVSDFFNISIGPVVPYRDKQDGEPVPYIHPKNLPAWEKVMVRDIDESWNYSGTLKKPPFVAIRRTSSPSDTYRASGAIISGKEKVAAENHLIIAHPISGLVRDCKKLLAVLRDENTNEFLNQRIRCRHLTVSAVKEIPWIDLGN